MSSFYYYETDIGSIGIEDNGKAITGLYLAGEGAKSAARIKETPLIREAARQLQEYMAGARTDFELPLAIAGTDFQCGVWQALREIPYGETRSYGQIAAAIGQPRASRAVGQANNRNPLPIVIPCHRVIGSGGRLTGYGGGLELKEYLLLLERSRPCEDLFTR